jgi:hypothetical protein
MQRFERPVLGRFLPRSLGHHSVFHEDKWWIVYCFADAEHAEKFRIRFGGERFNPKDRGRGSKWARWYKNGR